MTTYHNPTAIPKAGKVYFGFHATPRPQLSNIGQDEKGNWTGGAYANEEDYERDLHKWRLSEQFVEFKDQQGIKEICLNIELTSGVQTFFDESCNLDSIVHRIEVVEEWTKDKCACACHKVKNIDSKPYCDGYVVNVNRVAIIKPVKEEETQEGQDQLWKHVENAYFNFTIYKEKQKSWIDITKELSQHFEIKRK